MSDEARPEERRSDERRPDIARTRAQVRRGWWPGWIWAIPIAAVLLVGWWLLRAVFSGGENITITFDDVHGMKKNDTKVKYRGMQVGEVTKLELSKNGETVVATAQIQDAAAPFLTSSTQFWLQGAKPSLADPASLGSVLSGPTLIMEPGPGKKTDHFVGMAYRPVITGAHGPPDLYAVSLPGAVGGLSPGEPVKLRGFTVGDIKEIGFHYDPASGAIETPVTLALYPELFHIAPGQGSNGQASDGTAALKTAVADLIQKGLRARLERDPPVVGSPEVTLDFVPGEPNPASRSPVSGLPQIPAASGGGLNSIIDRVNKVPVDQIAQNVLDVTRHVDEIVASAALKDAIAQLDGALAQIRKTAETAGPQVSDLVSNLQKTSNQLDQAVRAVESTAKTAQQTAQAANNVLGGSPSQSDAQTAMRELTEAARSVRELATYLDRHPEALVQGRKSP